MFKTGQYHSDVAWHTNQSLGLMLITLTETSKTLVAGKGHRATKTNNNAVHRKQINNKCCVLYSIRQASGHESVNEVGKTSGIVAQ